MREPEELLPATRRALLHRVATGQAEGRTPSLVGAVVRDGVQVWCGSRSMIEDHEPDGDTQYRIGSRRSHSCCRIRRGWRRSPAGPWWERTPGELRPALGDIFGDRPQPLPAGRQFHYSNPGFALLGALAGQLRGHGWDEAVRRRGEAGNRALTITLVGGSGVASEPGSVRDKRF
jgi:hypothetical protein